MADALAVLLAGSLRPSPLREALSAPELCLPLGAGGSLLDAWRDVLHRAGIDDVRIVVNSDEEVETVTALLPARRRHAVRVIAEPASWRGTAGILRDVACDADPEARVVIAEASCLPPADLAPLMRSARPVPLGIIAVVGDQEPAGVMMLRRRAFDDVPAVGYHDLKEQLLPALHAVGGRVVTVPFAGPVRRLRDRDGYLDAVRARLGDAPHWTASTASVSRTAARAGFSLIESGAVVEDGAVIHASVVLAGATIGGGAVVSRSIVAPLGLVAPRTRVAGRIVPGAFDVPAVPAANRRQRAAGREPRAASSAAREVRP